MLQKFVFIAYLFIYAAGFAQQYPLVYYTPNNGLINSRVRDIRQDSKGRIYFLTYGGLSVYDGARFTNYGQREGLANELVNDVVEAAPDSLLVATNTKKLNTLVRGKIGVYETRDSFSPLINHFLKSEDGNWYVAADDGFFLLADKKFTRLPFSDQKGNDVGLFLDQIIEWNHYFLILPWKTGENRRLILYNRLTRQIADSYSGESIISIVKNSLGQIWVSTREGIRLIDPGKLQKEKIYFTDPPSKYNALKNIKNVSVFFDSENNLWLYNNTLIEKISPQFQHETIAAGRSLKTGNLLSMFEDREGIIWMASDGNGAIKIKGTNLQFINELGSIHLRASAIQTEGDTTWLFNVTDNAIYRVFGNSLQSFRLTTKIISPGSIYIVGNKIYIADQKKIISVKNKNDANAYRHPEIIAENIRQAQTFGYAIVDKKGSIIQLVNKNDTNFYLAVIRNDKIIMEQRIGALADNLVIDRSGKLWLATRKNHLMIFTIHPDKPSNYLELEKNFSGELPFLNPRSIAVDTNNNIWIGTRYNGIIGLQFNGTNLQTLVQLTVHDGLTDNFVYALHIDKENNIWAGTQSGLDKIFLKNGSYIVSNISRSNNFFQAINKIVKNSNQTTWALTNEGTVFKISPVAPRKLSPPPVLISLLKVNDKPGKGFSYRFSYKENNFLFDISAASFTDEKAIQYSYLLSGSGNNKWSAFSNNSALNFINLSPGNYILHVKAEFPDAMYSTQETSLSFIITPPWWQTWWFRILVFIIIASLFFFVIRTYVNRKLEKQQSIEKERTRIATDMHDDLGAGLSRIKFLSETIGIKKQKQEPIEEDITKIRQYSHEMIDKMGEIVWALNEKNDSLSDLLSYTRSYAVEYLVQNGISCLVEEPETIPPVFVTGEFRRNIFLTVKEALHNIVKHAQAGQVIMNITISKKLQIGIEDNGIGFSPTNIRPYSNGLTNMKKRIQDLNGSMEIKNNKGTVIILIAPLPL